MDSHLEVLNILDGILKQGDDPYKLTLTLDGGVVVELHSWEVDLPDGVWIRGIDCETQEGAVVLTEKVVVISHPLIKLLGKDGEK